MQMMGMSHQASDQELITHVADITAQENALAAARLETLAEIDRRRLAPALGHTTAARWYAAGTRITDGTAKQHIALGHWLTTHTSVRYALHSGDIHPAHASAIADGLAVIRTADPTLDDTDATTIVTTLLDTAIHGLAKHVTTRAQELAHNAAADAQARYDKAEQQRRDDGRNRTKASEKTPPNPPPPPPPGPPPIPAAENPALNTFAVHPLANGRSHVIGNFDALTTEKMLASLSPLAAPRPVDNEPDPRTPTRRNADALAAILDLHINGGQSPMQGGVRANVNLTVTLQDLISTKPPPTGGRATEHDWPFRLTWTGPIGRNLAELLTCDANLTPVILDGAGVPLAMGTSARLASPELRSAVVIRDRCCVKCGRPAQWCRVHHVVFWAHGGPTDLGNLALVCGECHHQIHHTDWELHIGDDGHPYLLPPTSIDPRRTPIPSYHRRRKHAA